MVGALRRWKERASLDEADGRPGRCVGLASFGVVGVLLVSEMALNFPLPSSLYASSTPQLRFELFWEASPSAESLLRSPFPLGLPVRVASFGGGPTVRAHPLRAPEDSNGGPHLSL